MDRIEFEAIQQKKEEASNELEKFESASQENKFTTQEENIEYQGYLEEKVQKIRDEMEYAISNAQANAETEELARNLDFQKGPDLGTPEQKTEAFRSIAHRMEDMADTRFFSHLKGVTEIMFVRSGKENQTSIILGYPDVRVASNAGTSIININREGHLDGYDTLPGIIRDVIKPEDILAEVVRCVHLQYPNDKAEVLNLKNLDEQGNVLKGVGAMSAYTDEGASGRGFIGGVEGTLSTIPYFGRDNLEMFGARQDIPFQIKGADFFAYDEKVHPMNREYMGFVNTWGVVKEATEQGNATFFFVFDKPIDPQVFAHISQMPKSEEKTKILWGLLKERGYFDDLTKSRGDLRRDGMRYPSNHPRMRRDGTLVSPEEYRATTERYCEDVFRYGRDLFEQKSNSSAVTA